MLKVTISGLETIDDDINAFMPRVDKATTAGLKAVASDMKANLKKHIQEDVYDAYSPVKYIRRHESGGMISDNTMSYAIGRSSLIFEYAHPTSPSYWKSGVKHWYDYDDGDDAIKAIQSGEGYPTATPDAGERPFWSNFIKEFFEGGMAEVSFVAGMNNADRDLRVTNDRSFFLEAEDKEETSRLEKAPTESAAKTYRTR